MQRTYGPAREIEREMGDRGLFLADIFGFAKLQGNRAQQKRERNAKDNTKVAKSQLKTVRF